MAVPSTPTGVKVIHTLQNITQQRVSWNANDISEGVTSYNIFRAPVPYVGFTLLGNTGNTTFDDISPLTYDVSWFYKVSAINVDGESSLSQAYSLEDFAYTIKPFADANLRIEDQTNFIQEYFTDEDTLMEISEVRERLHNLLEFGGEYAWWFPRKFSQIEGTEEESRRVDADYWDPLKIQVKFEPDNFLRVFQVEGARVEVKPKCWTLYYPKLGNKDVLVNRLNERYEVVNLMQRRFRGFMIRQEFDVQLLTQFATSDKLTPPSPLG